MALHDLLIASAARNSNVAVVEGAGAGTMDYTALDRLSGALRNRLAALGVRRGDRVGVYLRKSADGFASIFGILKAGAAYVPVDPTAPVTRNAYIHNNCAVAAAIVERRFEQQYREEIGKLGPVPPLIVLEDVGAGRGLERALIQLDEDMPALPQRPALSAPGDLAYILYTSGSTGKPKGVMLSHGNAESFVDWCSETFQPSSADVFSSHAPFHFDLSILDIYLPIKHGARCVLIPEEVGKDPIALSTLISTHRITTWYSAPSILSLLAQFGKISDHDYSSLRTVLFAGEVFPLVRLRSLKSQVPHPRYFNLYGPTETNVCTSYEVPKEIPAARLDPFPIGTVCSNLMGVVVDADGEPVEPGTEGELCIAGPNVMQGYWSLPALTAGCFLERHDGERWYKTGDIVVEEDGGNYKYVGRRDRMVKKRGYRVELGEIEACLYRHSSISEAAVVAVTDTEGGVVVKAHLSVRDAKRPSMIELKTFCSKNLPLYMVPDTFAFHDVLPKTSTDKIDYVSLKTLG